MTAPSIIPADMARALLEAATPGSWSCEPPREVISLAVSRVLREGSYLVAEVVAEHASLVAAAPDLAASVVALHAEVERAAFAERARIIALLTERAEATREHDGRESSVSLTYRQAAALIAALGGAP